MPNITQTHGELIPTLAMAEQQQRREYYKGEECVHMNVCLHLKKKKKREADRDSIGRSKGRLEAFCLHLSAHRPRLTQ